MIIYIFKQIRFCLDPRKLKSKDQDQVKIISDKDPCQGQIFIVRFLGEYRRLPSDVNARTDPEYQFEVMSYVHVAILNSNLNCLRFFNFIISWNETY
jgi:hypothetical protein